MLTHPLKLNAIVENIDFKFSGVFFDRWLLSFCLTYSKASLYCSIALHRFLVTREFLFCRQPVVSVIKRLICSKKVRIPMKEIVFTRNFEGCRSFHYRQVLPYSIFLAKMRHVLKFKCYQLSAADKILVIAIQLYWIILFPGIFTITVSVAIIKYQYEPLSVIVLKSFNNELRHIK